MRKSKPGKIRSGDVSGTGPAGGRVKLEEEIPKIVYGWGVRIHT